MSKLTKILAGVTLAASLGAWSQAYGDLTYTVLPISGTMSTGETLGLYAISTASTAQFFDGYGSLTATGGGTFSAFTINSTLLPSSTGSSGGTLAVGNGSINSIMLHGTSISSTPPYTSATGVSINSGGGNQLLGTFVYTNSAPSATVTFNPRLNVGGGYVSQVWTQGSTEFDDATGGVVHTVAAPLTNGPADLHIPTSTTHTVVGNETWLTVNKTNGDGGTLSIPNGTSLTISDTAATRQSRPIVTVLDGLTIGTTSGKFDIGNHDVIIRDGAANFADYVAALTAGYGVNQDWNGTQGITSTNAANNGFTLGILSNADFGLATFDGVALGANDVVIKYTYYGDVNLDGVVDTNDYGALDAYQNTSGLYYALGDVNYNGIVDTNDYGPTDAYQGLGSGGVNGDPLAAGLTAGAVPEPASLLLLAAGSGIALLRRRKN